MLIRGTTLVLYKGRQRGGDVLGTCSDLQEGNEGSTPKKRSILLCKLFLCGIAVVLKEPERWQDKNKKTKKKIEKLTTRAS